MQTCVCLGEQWWSGGRRVQSWADVMIAFAYFSIPLEMIYFASKVRNLPHKGTLFQFVLFIILCGTTHTFAASTLLLSRTPSVLFFAAFAKVATALVSCATALSLLRDIPRFLHLQDRERMLENKTHELDEEVGLLKRKEVVSRSVRMLAKGLYSSLDTMTILETTIVELCKVLSLRDCIIWASADMKNLKIVRAIGPCAGGTATIPTDTAELNDVLSSTVPLPLESHTVLLGGGLNHGRYAISLVMPQLTFGEFTPGQKQYVLVLAKDTPWTEEDMDVLEITNSQISVAISHAYLLADLKTQNSELIEARKSAEAGMLAREEFLAVVSHEMRTPLHAVLAIASVLAQSKSLIPDDQSMVTTISTSAGLLSVLIDDVLDMSRINRGDFHLRIAPFNFQALVQEAAKMVGPMARESGLTLKVESSNIPQWVLGDGKRCMQMCLNLLNNALKFTKHSIIFRIWESEPQNPNTHSLRIDVIDDGVGILKGELGSLCDRFHQLDNGREAGGMGLGLSICRHLARLMKGALWLDSPGLGMGTTASLYIHLQHVSMEAKKSILRRGESQGALQGLRVLVVDDNAINRLVTCKMLQKLGCDSSAVDSGEKCLERMRVKQFDACLMDLTMPKLDGIETTRSIFSSKELLKPRFVIALTADQRLETLSRCMDVGMVGMLTKPATLSLLEDNLLEHLSAERKSD
jgi:ethylene receptor